MFIAANLILCAIWNPAFRIVQVVDGDVTYHTLSMSVYVCACISIYRLYIAPYKFIDYESLDDSNIINTVLITVCKIMECDLKIL